MVKRCEVKEKMDWLKKNFDAISVDSLEEAEFIISVNNGVCAIYPVEEVQNAKRKQGPYWIEAGRCFCFSEKKAGCLHGDIYLMKKLLKERKVMISEGVWSSLYVPFSNCWPQGNTGVECLAEKIKMVIETVIEKTPEEIESEISKQLLLDAITVPEARRELERELGKDKAEITIFPAEKIWEILYLIKECIAEQKFRLPDEELLRFL